MRSSHARILCFTTSFFQTPELSTNNMKPPLLRHFPLHNSQVLHLRPRTLLLLPTRRLHTFSILSSYFPNYLFSIPLPLTTPHTWPSPLSSGELCCISSCLPATFSSVLCSMSLICLFISSNLASMSWFSIYSASILNFDVLERLKSLFPSFGLLSCS